MPDNLEASVSKLIEDLWREWCEGREEEIERATQLDGGYDNGRDPDNG